MISIRTSPDYSRHATIRRLKWDIATGSPQYYEWLHRSTPVIRAGRLARLELARADLDWLLIAAALKESMPLPKAQTNWTARIAVLLICGMTIGLVIPITWLLRALHAPELVLYPVLTIWAVIVILSALWMIAVWAPVRGKKIAERVLMSPWWF